MPKSLSLTVKLKLLSNDCFWTWLCVQDKKGDEVVHKHKLLKLAHLEVNGELMKKKILLVKGSNLFLSFSCFSYFYSLSCFVLLKLLAFLFFVKDL